MFYLFCSIVLYLDFIYFIQLYLHTFLHLGGLVILKNSGNMVATFVDAGAAFVISVAYLTAMTDGEAIVASFVFALGVALFETFFHN
ncbi:DUF2512 family protein [Alkalibacterium sp. s-m-28]